MNKIVLAINAMISNADKITDLFKKGNEYYFLYNGKHKWSILYNEESDVYNLYYYGDHRSVAEIANSNWQEVIYTRFSTDEYKAKEAVESFSELYKVVSSKFTGVDKAIDDIISGL